MLQGLAGLNAWGKAGAVPVFPAVDRLFDEARTQGQNRKSPSRECGPVAQLGARFHGMEEVIGSIPIRSTKHFKHLAHSFQVACPPTAKTCSTAVSLSSQSRLPEPSSAPLVVGLLTLEEAVSASLFGPAAILTPASESILRSRSFGAGSYQLVLDCVERLPHLGLERLHGMLLRSCRRPLGAWCHSAVDVEQNIATGTRYMITRCGSSTGTCSLLPWPMKRAAACWLAALGRPQPADRRLSRAYSTPILAAQTSGQEADKKITYEAALANPIPVSQSRPFTEPDLQTAREEEKDVPAKKRA